MSWYQLTIEPNTLFYYKQPQLPDDDDLWDIFEIGHQKLTEAGYVQYETSGYSKPEYQCRHNLNYWRFGDYLGIGLRAHGKLSFSDGRIIRTTKIKHLKGYLAAFDNMVKPYLSSEHNVEDAERPFEFFMNRFRLTEACPKNDFISTTGLSLKCNPTSNGLGYRLGIHHRNRDSLASDPKRETVSQRPACCLYARRLV